MSLIIVESPTKARTFNRFLKGKDYFVFATLGHIRDLPKDQLAIDYSKDFLPKYEILKNKEKIVSFLKKIAQKNQEIILATDLDREGESIAYHIAYILGFIKEKWPDFEIKNNNKIFKRIIFHEITQKAIKEALDNPINIRINLVKAQQGRRILDRMVGYELSPLLWKKIGKKWLSAGRVQTIALRLIVEREKEIKNFPKKEYYDVFAYFSLNSDKNFQIKAKLIAKDRVNFYQKSTIKLFAGDYTYSFSTIDINLFKKIKEDLLLDQFFVDEIKERIEIKNPPPPFTTALLQQEAFYHFRFSSKLTMKLAQDLYERGLITYHRTDSFNLNFSFIFKLRDYIKNKFGENYLSDSPRIYKTKSKLAQEAHEAIRPTQLKKDLEFKSINHKKLYQLIFQRTLATQMKEVSYKLFEITIKSKKDYLFKSEIKKIIFDGFLKVLNPKKIDKEITLPLKKSDQLILDKIEEIKKEVQPPSRYNEASLIKILEEKEIGRPSTYATILSLIQNRFYVEKINRYFFPTKLGMLISDYLSSKFLTIFNLNFTAKLEEDLDKIANGEKDLIKTLSNFYLPFKENLDIEKNDKTVINAQEKIDERCPQCGNDLVIRYSRFGKFIACQNYPECKFKKPFLYYVKDKNCPQCDGKVVVKFSKNKKKFYGCSNWPKCQWMAWKIK